MHLNSPGTWEEIFVVIPLFLYLTRKDNKQLVTTCGQPCVKMYFQAHFHLSEVEHNIKPVFVSM